MAKKVNRKMIGGFVVVAIGILAASIAIFGSGEMFKERIQFVLYFDDSIKGLNVGAPVLTKGVKAGAVKQIIVRTYMDDLTSTVAVFIEIYPESFDVVTQSEQHLDPLDSLPGLIDKGLRAQLVSQSMVTGQLSIEFVMRFTVLQPRPKPWTQAFWKSPPFRLPSHGWRNSCSKLIYRKCTNV